LIITNILLLVRRKPRKLFRRRHNEKSMGTTDLFESRTTATSQKSGSSDSLFSSIVSERDT